MLDRFLFMVGSLLVFLWLGRSGLYSHSESLLLAWNGGQGGPFGFSLYFELVDRVQGLSGLGHFTVARWSGAVVTALGVGLFHAAAQRVTGGRRRTNLVTGVLATCPGVVACGTHVSDFPLAFLLTAFAFWIAAALVRHPSTSLAVATGVATATAGWGHVSLGWLPVAVVVLVWFEARERRRLALNLLVLCLVHAGLVRLNTWVLTGVLEPEWLRVDRPALEGLLGSLHREWFRPFMAASLLVLLGLFSRRFLLRTLVLLLALVPFLLLVPLYAPADLHLGLVLLPMAWPLAMQVVRCFDNRTCGKLILAGAVVSLLAVTGHQPDPRAKEYAADLQHLVGAAPTAVLSFRTRFENEALLVHADEVAVVDLKTLFDRVEGAPEPFVEQLDAAIQPLLDQGKRVFVGNRAEAEVLRTLEHVPAVRALLPHLVREYELVPIVHRSFRGTEIRRPVK